MNKYRIYQFFDILETINKEINKGEKAFKNIYLQPIKSKTIYTQKHGRNIKSGVL